MVSLRGTRSWRSGLRRTSANALVRTASRNSVLPASAAVREDHGGSLITREPSSRASAAATAARSWSPERTSVRDVRGSAGRRYLPMISPKRLAGCAADNRDSTCATAHSQRRPRRFAVSRPWPEGRLPGSDATARFHEAASLQNWPLESSIKTLTRRGNACIMPSVDASALSFGTKIR